MTIIPLTTIVALARLGAVDRAWHVFEQAGYVARRDDPATLAVKGRLLKDRAWRADGAERLDLLARAGAAYADADALAPAPYLLINVATLATLAGDPARGAALAGEVLTRLRHDPAETPYYIAATEAEALLLCGDRAAAEQAMARAAAALPDGWDERAGTLRQLARVLAATGEDDAWLDRFRAPTSLHYAGHLGIAPPGAEGLRSEIARVIADRRVGFAFGALAAGADLLIAEAVLAAGAELHIVLPCPPEAFVQQSVAPYGAAWVARYEACLAAAASRRIVARTDRRFDSLPTVLAVEVAMGAALLSARRMAAKALQLVVVDDGPGPFGSGAHTARGASVWPERPRTDRVVLRWPRDAPVPPASGEFESPQHRSLKAILLIAPGTEIASDDALDDWIDQVRLPLGPALMPRSAPPHVQPHGNALLLAFADIAAAAEFAVTASNWASARQPTIITAAYGLVRDMDGTIAGSAVSNAHSMLAAGLSGTVIIDQAFANVLALRADQPSAMALGDYDGPLGSAAPLYALIEQPIMVSTIE